MGRGDQLGHGSRPAARDPQRTGRPAHPDRVRCGRPAARGHQCGRTSSAARLRIQQDHGNPGRARSGDAARLSRQHGAARHRGCARRRPPDHRVQRGRRCAGGRHRGTSDRAAGLCRGRASHEPHGAWSAGASVRIRRSRQTHRKHRRARPAHHLRIRPARAAGAHHRRDRRQPGLLLRREEQARCRARSVRGAISYDYDPAGRLVAKIGRDQSRERYEYDRAKAAASPWSMQPDDGPK